MVRSALRSWLVDKRTRRCSLFLAIKSSELPKDLGPIERATGQLVEQWHSEVTWIARDRATALDDVAAHNLMIRAVDVGVVLVSTLPKVVWPAGNRRQQGPHGSFVVEKCLNCGFSEQHTESEADIFGIRLCHSRGCNNLVRSD